MLADGGDALCDLRALRDRGVLFGAVASDATAWRVIDAIAEHGLLDALRAARATARERAWALGARPEGPLVIDIDATLVTAHSDKDGAAGTYKGGFGFRPLLAYLDGPSQAAAGQPLAGMLRAGNAGANHAGDHVALLADALGQLPRQVVEDAELVLRADSAGATHELLGCCRDARIRFLVGYDLTQPVRAAILALPENAWVPALDQDGRPRDNGQVAEITDRLDLTAWPPDTRVIVRRERPHPGAQLSFTDHDGHRFQAILTDQHARTSPPWNVSIAPAPASRTASAPPRTAAFRTCPSATLSPTPCGSSSSSSPKNSSSMPRPSRWTASSRAANPSACATDCCTAPAA